MARSTEPGGRGAGAAATGVDHEVGVELTRAAASLIKRAHCHAGDLPTLTRSEQRHHIVAVENRHARHFLQPLEDIQERCAGLWTHFPKRNPVIRSHRLRELRLGIAVAECQQASRLATKIRLLQTDEAANQKSGADQEHQGQCNLAGYQQTAQSGAAD